MLVAYLGGYRLFADAMLALGYAGTGATGEAEKIRARLGASDPATILPDKTTLGGKIAEIDAMTRDKEAPHE